MSRLCLGGRVGSSSTLWAADVSQPGTAVELAVGDLDLVILEAIGRWLNDQRIETLDLLRTWVGNPSDDDGVASVPGLEDFERNVRLLALASEESSLRGKGEGAKLEKENISEVSSDAL